MVRKWTILDVGGNCGIVGPAGDPFDGHPDHYDRVAVVDEKAYEQLRDSLVECLSWIACQCGHPACGRCRATQEATAALAEKGE